MSEIIRQATEDDAVFLQEALLQTIRHLREQAPSPYSLALRDEVDDGMRGYIRACLHQSDAKVWLVEQAGEKLACLMARLGATDMPQTGMGTVGLIELCWVREDARRRGLAEGLLRKAEQWFREQGMTQMELSYLAGNTLAEQAWQGLGFSPFRVYAYKPL